MKPLFLILLLLVLVAVIAEWIMTEPGLVLFVYHGRRVEMPFTIFVTLAAISFVIAYAVLRFLWNLWLTPGRLARLSKRHTTERARKELVRGLIELAEGRWSRSERVLLRSARKGETPLLNYLAAARAAQLQGAYERRDEYLRWAIESDPKADMAVGLTQAELQLDHDQMEQALATLAHLSDVAPKHEYVIRLLATLYHRQEDWEKLLPLLPELRRRKAMEPDELTALEETAVAGALRHAAEQGDLASLEAAWKTLPRASRQRKDLIKRYTQALIDMKEHAAAESLLRAALNREWDEELAQLFGCVSVEDPTKALSQAEGWLNAHGHSAMLLLTLGRLSKQAKLWGKARSYLESSLSAEPLPATYRELGDLLHSLGEEQNAQACYHMGLRLAVDGVAEPLRLEPSKPKEAREPAPVPEQPDIYTV